MESLGFVRENSVCCSLNIESVISGVAGQAADGPSVTACCPGSDGGMIERSPWFCHAAFDDPATTRADREASSDHAP